MGRHTSTTPAATALSGIPPNLAVEGSWARVTPSAALIAASPRVPSLPVPERTTPTPRGPRSAASASKNRSIDMCGLCGSRLRDESESTPSFTPIVPLGGMT